MLKFLFIYKDLENKKRQKTIIAESMSNAIMEIYEKEKVKSIMIIKYKGRV